MDPPADHDGEEKGLRRRPPQRGTAVGSRYARLLLALSFFCFVFTLFIYNRFLTPYLEVMTLSIDQPLRDDDNLDKQRQQQKSSSFHLTAFYEHIQLRQSNNHVHHDNNFTHSSQSTLSFTTGGNKNSDTNVRISFQLHDPKVLPLQNVFNLYEKCPLGQVMQGHKKHLKPSGEVREGILPPSLSNVVQSNDYPRDGRVLNFTATITTNLKILSIGDSVLLQLAQAFDEMVGCRNNNNGTGFNCRPRVVTWEAWAGHDGRTIVPSTIGGGVSAMWR